MPKISIIMGIYNCSSTLPEALQCIEEQTYQDWEIILCDDGSSDNTYEIASAFANQYPQKVRLLRNDTNCGLNFTLNKCLAEATGAYIARMDGDDICSVDRFEKEVYVLDNEKDIAIVSTDIEHFDEMQSWGYVSHPEYPQPKDFLHGTPFCHAPCMVRKEAFLAVEGYTESKRLLRVEDYHLWIKMYAAGFRGKNINIPLYNMRDDRNALGRRKFKYRINEAYVRILAVKQLKLPFYGYLYSLKPIFVGLLPKSIYKYLHKKRLGR